jgi:predicted Fe-S protein YdhL (DUF1289 family)
MTKYRPVIRTCKYGSIKRHADLDWVYYAQFSISYKGERIFFSKTTRTLEEAEQWIETEREAQKEILKAYRNNAICSVTPKNDNRRTKKSKPQMA